MSNKNPFEIRAEMLQMAKDYMDQTWTLNAEFARQAFEQNKLSAEEMQKALVPYTLEDMMAKAKDLYAFVSTKPE
jgi:hypothetical protein